MREALHAGASRALGAAPMSRELRARGRRAGHAARITELDEPLVDAEQNGHAAAIAQGHGGAGPVGPRRAVGLPSPSMATRPLDNKSQNMRIGPPTKGGGPPQLRKFFRSTSARGGLRV